jgi:hypothetical protein
MSKPTHEQLVDATAAYLPAYVGKGVSVDPVIENLDPEINIRDITALLESRFLISGRNVDADGTPSRADLNLVRRDTGGITDQQGTPVGVLDFMSLLRPRLRSIEPAITTELKIQQGEVDGPIDWPQTVKHRHQSGDQVGSTFAVRTQQRSVQTTQNRVLIRLLQVLKQLVEELGQRIKLDSPDLDGFTLWREESPLRTTLNQAFENPNLKELLRSTVSVSNRDIQDVMSDRRPLYREAATLLRTIRDIRSGVITDEQARDLFRMKLFAPSPDDGTSDLFELYWIFQLLDQFEQPRFNQITNDRGQLIAHWETPSTEYLLFNDWKGFHRFETERGYRDYLKFTLDIPDTPLSSWLKDQSSEFLRRQLATQHIKHDIHETVFEYTPDRKSPDIVLLKLDPSTTPETLEKVFIGEVKHSTSRTTVLDGVQQLLEYGANVKLGPHLQLDRDTGTEYIADSDDILSTPELEMGYFIGDADEVRAKGPESIQIRGFGDPATHPFGD